MPGKKKGLFKGLPLRSIVLIGIVIILIGAVYMFGLHVSRSWQEEVKLISGSTIVIDRRLVRERFGEQWLAGRVVKQTIKFDKPGGAIHWVGDIDPLVFDFVNGKPYVAAFLSTGEDCERYGNPDSPFILFEYANEEWHRIRADEFPDGLAFNLLRNAWWTGQPSLVTLAIKLDRDWNPPKYLTKFDKNLNKPCRYSSSSIKEQKNGNHT